MGDRCYLALYIHGHIKTADDLRKIINALEEEGLGSHGRDSAIEAFAVSATKMHDVPQFYMDECNYADITEVENTLRLCDVAYFIDHGAGDSYGAGARSWTRERGLHAVDCDNNGHAVIDIPTIEAAIERGDLEEILQHARWANGKDLPEFTVSEEVMTVLAKAIAVKAHNLQNITAEMIFSNPGGWMTPAPDHKHEDN